MYQTFFGLNREPFSVAPDPHFMYLSPKHREAVGLLMYGLGRATGVVMLTGEIGAGKTTVWRSFLGQLPANVDVAYVVNPRLGVKALLTRVCEDLRIEIGDNALDLIDAIHGHLLLAAAQGRRTLIVVDEAQALSRAVLEQLRLLTNLDTTGGKLQIFLIGQPELRVLMRRPLLEPLAQRVVARFHLPALPEEETARYVAHRLSVAGLRGPLPFDEAALQAVHRLCSGVPRRINVLCDRAMHAAYAAGSPRIDAATVERAADEVFGVEPPPEAAAPAAPSPGNLGVQPNPPAPGPSLWRGAPTGAAVGILLLAGTFLGIGIAPTLSSLGGGARNVRPIPVAAPPAAAEPARAVPEAPAPSPPGPATANGPARDSAPAAEAVAAEPARQPAEPARAAQWSAPALLESASKSESDALRDLALLWEVPLGPGDGCAAALKHRLLCFRTKGGLSLIRELDRPSILTLTDDAGRVGHALLVGLGADQATFQVAGARRSLKLADLARIWRGEFTTLWRTPPGYRASLPDGGLADWGTWLATRLAEADGGTAPLAEPDALKARVLAYQIAHGLGVDGVPGPRTLMMLNKATGITEPRLVVAN